ncbi:MAG: signal peptidase II [Anaerolineae bacterium]|nr:signal peptidase II [Anaerolineae bacterium]
MNKLYRMMLILIVVGCCVGVDQAAKAIARRTLASSAPISLLGGLVIFEYAENTGAFMSLGAQLPVRVRTVLWIGVVGVMMIVGLVYLARTDELDLPQTLVLACVIGGGIGNLIDRIVNNGAVVDYVSVGIGRLRTGILNIADLFVTFGVIALVWLIARSRPRPSVSTPEPGVS